MVFCYINLSNLLWTKGFDTVNFPFTRKQGSRSLFSGKQASREENRPHNLFSIVKCCEKNKMDNAQNGYSSVDNTGKIKKMIFPSTLMW